MKILNGLPLLAAGMLVVGCGGGGSPTPTPTPANRAPTLDLGTSSVSVAENTGGTLLTAGANDPDGDSLSFRLSGSDEQFFTVDASGNLSFKAPPNFDLYADSDGDNQYDLSVEVSDGRGGSAQASVTITVTNDREGIAVTRILTGLSDPVGITPTYANGRELAVGLKDGSYVLISGDRAASDPIAAPVVVFPAAADFTRLLDIAWGEAGIYWSGPMFLYESSYGFRVIRDGGYQETTLTFGTNHQVEGRLFIGAGGEALAALGDPSGDFAQDTSTRRDDDFGRLYRIETPGCGASVRGLCEGQLALGVRQPGGFAAIEGEILFADQGGSAEHEVSFVTFDPLSYKSNPLNLGWPFLEGTTSLRTGAPTQLRNPSLAYSFDDGLKSGTGIVMGAHYTGAIPGITGHLVFADTNGSIFSIPSDQLTPDSILGESEIELRNLDFVPDVGSIDRVVEVAADASGVLYILDADGDVFRVDQV